MNEIDLADRIAELDRSGFEGVLLDRTGITAAEARTMSETLRRRGRRVTVLAAESVVIDLTSPDE